MYESFSAWHAAEWNSGTSSPDDDLDIVRAALRRWDPIGIHPEWPECPAKDEYDRYAPGVLESLRAGVSEADLAGYLRKLRTEHMSVYWDLPMDETI
ncbi:MAG TPA: hypothetical protein VNT75_25285, partial [Symbiobacteriaceae bacterium]|nr:hypothetical protein [Symbiobacteriaceae bacterium]